MCLPEEQRSIEGKLSDLVYEHLQKTRFCKYAVDKDFVQFMTDQNGKLRDRSDRYEIMTVVEAYVTKWRKEWSDPFLKYMLSDFLKFLKSIGELSKTPGREIHQTAFVWLCYFVGVAALDEAHGKKLLK